MSLYLAITLGLGAYPKHFALSIQFCIGSPKHSRRSASGWTKPAQAAPRVPNLSAGLPTYCLIKLQFRDRLRIRMRNVARAALRDLLVKLDRAVEAERDWAPVPEE